MTVPPKNRLDRPVLFFALAGLSLGGCYASHELLDSRDAGVRDGGVRDAGASDAGALDAGSGRCRPAPAATVCVDGETRPFLSAVASTSLLVRTDDCHCGGELRCEVRVDGGQIALDTTICDEEPCRACTAPVDVRCVIPPVAPGPHRLFVNGEAAFELHAMPSGGAPPTTLCQHVGSSGGGLCAFPGDLTAWRPDRVCFRERSLPHIVEIAFEKDGTGCHLEPGPCDVYASEAGLEIRPRIRSCDEGSSTWGCVGMSGTLRRVCRLLDIAPGAYPMSLQDGTSLGTVTVREGELSDETCRAIEP